MNPKYFAFFASGSLHRSLSSSPHLHRRLLQKERHARHRRGGRVEQIQKVVVQPRRHLRHPREMRLSVQLPGEFLRRRLRLTRLAIPYVHARNLHPRVHHGVLELVAAGRAVPHGDHAMALGALQPVDPVLLLLLHRPQLALAHAAEPHLLVAVRAGDAPVRAREPGVLLGVPGALQIALATRVVHLRVDRVARRLFDRVGRGSHVCERVWSGKSRGRCDPDHHAED